MEASTASLARWRSQCGGSTLAGVGNMPSMAKPSPPRMMRSVTMTPKRNLPMRPPCKRMDIVADWRVGALVFGGIEKPGWDRFTGIEPGFRNGFGSCGHSYDAADDSACCVAVAEAADGRP